MGDKQDFAKAIVGQINSDDIMGLVQQSVKQTPALNQQDGSTILGACQKFNNMVSGIPIVGGSFDKLKELIAPAVPALATLVGGTVNVTGQVASIAAPVAGAVLGGLAGTKIKGADKALASDLGKLGGSAGGGVIGGLTSSISQAAADLTTGLLQPGQKGVNAGDLVGVVAQNAKVNGRVDGREIDAVSTNLVGLVKGIEVKPEQIQAMVEKAMQKPPKLDAASAAIDVGTKPFTPQAHKQAESKASDTSPSVTVNTERVAPSKPGKH